MEYHLLSIRYRVETKSAKYINLYINIFSSEPIYFSFDSYRLTDTIANAKFCRTVMTNSRLSIIIVNDLLYCRRMSIWSFFNCQLVIISQKNAAPAKTVLLFICTQSVLDNSLVHVSLCHADNEPGDISTEELIFVQLDLLVRTYRTHFQMLRSRYRNAFSFDSERSPFFVSKLKLLKVASMT